MSLPKTTTILFMIVLCLYSFVLFHIYKAIQIQTTNLLILQRVFSDRHLGHGREIQRQIKRIHLMLPNISDSTQCKEKQNLVFIKCMKCATETMATVIRRFGYTRNLSFVLPASNHIYLGWPYLMEKEDYRPPRRQSRCTNCGTGYNILMEHAIYNRSIMRSLMPTNTVYISIIREPYDHFLSTFHYFNLKRFAAINQTDYISEYLNNYHKYEAIYKSKRFNEHYCIPNNFSITENLMAHCLGIPLGFPADRRSIASYSIREITRYLRELDSDFHLVMLVEYFDESLVLLRRLMCWEMKDIVFHKCNVGGYDKSNSSNNRPKKQNKQLHKSYNRVDYILYDHFNRTFWEKINRQTLDFFDEVNYFRKIQAKVTEFCEIVHENKSTKQFITIKQSFWNNAFNFTSHDCQLMYIYLLSLIQSRYDKEMVKLEVLTHNPIRNIC